MWYVTSSKRDKDKAAVVMQINFTDLKSEINALQRIVLHKVEKLLVI